MASETTSAGHYHLANTPHSEWMELKTSSLANRFARHKLIRKAYIETDLLYCHNEDIAVLQTVESERAHTELPSNFLPRKGENKF